MSLKDRIYADRSRVFMQMEHFADEHTWNGISFVCVTDEEAASSVSEAPETAPA